MAGRRKLVLEHLENVSWKVLDEYPDIVRDMIRGKSGVYALYRRDKLYYVGLASNLMGRVKRHLRDRHGGAWSRFSVYITSKADIIKELESLMLRIAAPPGNRSSGRLTNSSDLRSELSQRMREEDEAKRARLMGGRLTKVHRRRRRAGARGAKALEGAVARSIRLKGEHRGWEYRASLRPTGQIAYAGEFHDSPGAAARAAGVRRDGWSFWQYRDRREGWVPVPAHHL